MEERRYRGGVVWPVVFIGAGILLLLNNFGSLDWSIWLTLARLWPVLLIAGGLEILIGRKSALGSAIIALLLVGVLALAVAGKIGGPVLSAGDRVERTESVSVRLEGAERADVEIDFGTGELIVGALPADSGDLLTGTLDLSRNEQLGQSHSSTNGRAQVNLRSENSWASSFSVPNVSDKQWELALNRNVPLTLSFDTGLGQSDLDLTQLNLARLDVNGGIGEVTVKLPGRGRFEMNLNGGIGQITVILPESLAARIQADGGLGSVDVAGAFEKNDDQYVSSGFATAENRAEIRIDGGVGNIRVRQATE